MHKSLAWKEGGGGRKGSREERRYLNVKSATCIKMLSVVVLERK
jgi:hypothetical protein